MQQFNTTEWREKQTSLIYSVDLTEATYNMPFNMLEENYAFLADVFEDNPVWEVYSDLFQIIDREVDLTILKEQGFEVPAEKLSIRQGSFMGDGLSFMHLTIMLSTLVNVASSDDETKLWKELVKRPFGQSVGDDLVLLSINWKLCKKFSKTMEDFCMKVSKVNSQFISGVFAEQYMMYIVDERDKAQVGKESLFGDLWFIDSIKTMLLTGHSKVSSEKRNSFIGQANALNKQLAYLKSSEFDWKRLRCRIYLWVFNYNDAVKLGRAKPHLPSELGGLDVPIGACDPPQSEIMEGSYLPYFYSMLEMSQEEFLGYYLLLKGIFKSTPKGVPWSNDPDRVLAVCSVANILHRDDVESQIRDIGEFYTRMGQLEKLRYLNKTKGWVSAAQIDEELSRRETYLEFWYNPDSKRQFKTLKTSQASERHKLVWNFIREHISPSEPKYYHRGEIFTILANEFRTRLWGFFVHREDPAIRGIFEGVNSFFIDFDEIIL